MLMIMVNMEVINLKMNCFSDVIYSYLGHKKIVKHTFNRPKTISAVPPMKVL